MIQRAKYLSSSAISRSILVASVLVMGLAILLMLQPPAADASVVSSRAMNDGSVRTTYSVGPINVTPGQNRIAYKPLTGSERPPENGYITRIRPDLVEADGSIPLSSRVMFHHGVWINNSAPPADRLFYATGEEKTIMDLPEGYGYRYKKNDSWLLNHMLHNLTPEPMSLYVTYTVDFIPDTAPQATTITEARPIWMDVENGIYPVFDVHRGSGGKDGVFTYPQDAENPYPPGVQKNEKTIQKDGVLISTTGHVHTGGLTTDLYLKRDGAEYAGPLCEAAPSFEKGLAKYSKSLKKLNRSIKKQKKSIKSKKMKRLKSKSSGKYKKLKKAKKKKLKKLKKQKGRKLTGQKKLKAKDRAAKKVYQACADTQPSVTGNRVHLFESVADYFEPAGPVSWDVAMRSTDEHWRVAVKAGDTLELQTDYETEIASWYESMGINVVYWAEEAGGNNPYETKVDQEGVTNHGHYAENDDHGGTTPLVGPDPAKLPNGLASGGVFEIGGYSYGTGGDFRLPGALGRPPVVEKGQSFTFKMSAADQASETWHSLTSCKSPCNKSTGIAYPIPDGEFQFDSGQMGLGGEPTVNRDTWSTPADLPVGTHTFFCRIHPLMRGAVRVVKPGS
ncbi:MAG: hypothetical protein WBP55_02870 [Solirubrobacterales bacterium]